MSVRFPKSAREGAWSCVPCDRGFDTAADAALHIAQHETCAVPACSFSACARALAAHMSSAHRTSAPPVIPPDLLELIPASVRSRVAAVGDSPDDIARWRAERRRHFPTDANIAEKRERESARDSRGELPLAGPSGKLRRRDATTTGTGVTVRGDAAQGMSAVGRGAGAVGEGGRMALGEEIADPDAAPPHGGGGDENESGSAPEEESSARPAQDAATSAGGTGAGAGAGAGGRRPCHAFARGHCRFGSSCRYSHVSTGGGVGDGAVARPPPGSNPAVCRWYLLGVCAAGTRCPFQHTATGSAGGAAATGLLRKLLTRDVQRETSMLLQAIRFFAQEGLLN